MTLKPGSVKTISEALLAASVESATAIPMSAFFKAGASLTPSPVIPTTCFFSCKIFTISYLCSESCKAVISYETRVIHRWNNICEIMSHTDMKTPYEIVSCLLFKCAFRIELNFHTYRDSRKLEDKFSS